MHFFAIPALHPEEAQSELNAFCAAHRVVSIERQFVAAGVQSYWALCLVVATGPGPLPSALKVADRRSAARTTSAASRIDYKDVLSEAEFARFAALRAWRKTAAEAEGIPIYAVFTNEQLAEIARRNVDTLTALGEIDGIGPARLERYGAAVISVVQATPADGKAD